MELPVMPPVPPMLAKSVATIPAGMQYEPKWDGFRAIVFRDGDDVVLGSRNERPLTRYFPELVAAMQEALPPRCVLDGEIIVATGDRLDFEALQQRIHPAASRVTSLSQLTPASFVAFDVLALGDENCMSWPLARRRDTLAALIAAAPAPTGASRVYLTPATTDLTVAQRWFEMFEGAGLDGVVAKPPDLTYQPDKRAMFKIKHERTADCVVAGYRWHKTSTPAAPLLGSLLLGLYDEAGNLQHVGVAASFTTARRRELVEVLAPYRTGDGSPHPWSAPPDTAPPDAPATGGAAPAGAARRTPNPAERSRWAADKDLSFVALRPDLVIEVAFDHMEGTRFRHTAQFRRWRPERDPASCTYAQLDRPVAYDLASVLASS